MTEPRASRRPRSAAGRQMAVMAGVLALGAMTLAGVVAVLMSGEGESARVANFDPALVDIPPVQSPVQTPAPAESSGGVAPGVAGPAPDAADGRSGVEAPPPEWLPTAEPSGAAETGREPGQVAALPPDESELVTPMVVPPVERRGIPGVPQTDVQPAEDTAAVAGRGTIDSQSEAAEVAEREEIDTPPNAAVEAQAEEVDGQPDSTVAAEAVAADSAPDAALVAELEEIRLIAQAVASDLTRRRDLHAANLALAQGRLTAPPEANAYTLYNRVLALDPGSPEATSGLQAVRQGLINRALAQLAGGDLDDARGTLQAAADAGADPMLVADLRAEVDYRQRLGDDSSGR